MDNPDSTYTEYEYDDNGNRIEFRDELARSQLWEYDESGRLTKYTNGRGDENTYTYNTLGQVEYHTNGNSTVWNYVYTARGDLLALWHPDGGLEAWVHDENGNLASHEQEVTNNVGYVSYDYDDDSQLTHIYYPTYAADVTFGYDAAGRRDTMVDGQGPTYWGYDLAGQVISLDTPQGDLTYTYNDDGTRDTMTEVGVGTMSYAWDPTTGQLNSITNRFSETTTYSYHPTLGTLDTKILDSGQFEEYRYDSRYRLDRVRLYDNTITLLHETEYEFNEASEVESSVIDTVQTDYTYDGASQILTEVRSGYNCTYTYDDNGNRLSKTIAGGIAETYNYNSAELLTSVTWNGGSNYKNYTYDSAGRRIQENNTGTSRYFAYDEESRLTAISGAYSATYDYNGLDTRVEKAEASVTRNFMRDGVDVTSPVLNDGAAAYTPGISERRSSTTTYMHSGLKNADYQTDTSQLLVADRTYDAFGNLTGGSGTWQGPFGYAGQFGYQEDGSGLRLLGHRYYDPTIGRFLTRDPAKHGTNWYGYCGNNPVTNSDPSGLCFSCARNAGPW